MRGCWRGSPTALILMVRSGVTTRDAALLAKTRFAEDGTPILGTILNFWNPQTPGYGYYKNYYAGYFHYYGPGGGDPPADGPSSGNGSDGGRSGSDNELDSERDGANGSTWRPGFVFRRDIDDARQSES